MIFRQVFETMSLGDLGVLGERMPLAEIAKDAKDNREDTLRDQNPWRLGKMKGIEPLAEAQRTQRMGE